MTLFEIDARIRDILASAAENDGEMTPEEAAEFDRLTPTLDSKVDVYAGLIEEARTRIMGRDQTIDRLRVSNGVDQRLIDRLKARLLDWLRVGGHDRHQTAHHLVWRQKTAEFLDCLAKPEDLPAKFLRVKVEPNTEAAREEYKATGQVPEGFQAKRTEFIRIK